MGNDNSKPSDDKDPLLDSKEIQDFPLFEQLNLVIIGSHCAGKNEVANAILQKKAFRIWGKFCRTHVKNSGVICQRKIELVRAPGWSGDLQNSVNKQKQIKKQIVYSVQSHFKKGPHAILLALDVDSTFTNTTMRTLENLLTEELWDHTVVMFTHGEKLKDITINDQIRVNQLKTFIKRCGKRYYVLKKNTTWSAELIDTIEYFIASKDTSVQFCLSDREEADSNDLTEKKSLITRLKNKISKLTEFRNTRFSTPTQDDSYQRLIDSKDAEIRRLKAVLRKKEDEICRLEAQNAALQDSVASSRCVMCERKDEQIRLLQEEVSKLKDEKHTGRNTSDTHVQQPDRSRFPELNSMDCLHQRQPSSNSIEMQRLPAVGTHHAPPQDLLCEWPSTLNNVLNELTGDQFKDMKNLLEFRDKWRISASLLESRDRAAVTKLLIQTWGERQCLVNTRDIMKEIPRNDKVIRDLFTPFLQHIGETW